MHKGYLKTAAILGALSVALGAFAAHTLKQNISVNALEIFETAVKYQFYHVFALLIAGIIYKEFPNKFVNWSGKLFIAGIILFSGSLYLLTAVKAVLLANYNWIGAITPLGGLCFILGWIFLFIGISKKG
ncbi:MAG TPA: DUF423 domain-containing protein [Hanamia sp.]|jgi:uncharacterized membrane protein YgdD (TMEM256/DUF423 family)|nr:DUF423 domain-containing protein [Hanamia sp.]